MQNIDFKLQVFQHTIASFYAIPLRLYNSKCIEDISEYLSTLDSDFFLSFEKFLNSYDSLKVYAENYEEYLYEIFIEISKLIKDNNKEFIDDLLKLFTNEMVTEINSCIWKTRPSYAMPYVRKLKLDDRIWKLLVLGSIKNSRSNMLSVLGLDSIFIKFDDLYIVLGKIFIKNTLSINKRVNNFYNDFHPSFTDRIELQRLANLRDEMNELKAKELLIKIRNIFKILNSISHHDIKFSKDDLELITLFVIFYIQSREDEKKEFSQIFLLLKDSKKIVTIKNTKIVFVENIDMKDKTIIINSDKIDKKYAKNSFNRILKRFKQNSKVRELEYINLLSEEVHSYEVSQSRTDTEKILKKTLKKICNTIQADGAIFYWYNINKEKIDSFTVHGKLEYSSIELCKEAICHDRDIVKNQHICKNRLCSLSLANAIIDNCYMDNLDEYYLYSDDEKKLCFPALYRGKLIGVLVVSSDKWKVFNQESIRIVDAVSHVIANLVYKHIYNTNLFNVFNTFSNENSILTYNENNELIKRICTNLTELFFCSGIAFWEYNKEEKVYIKRATTIRDDKNSKSISENSNSVIDFVKRNKRRYIIENLQKYNSKRTKDQPELKFEAYKYDKKIKTLTIHPILDNRTKNFLGALSIYNDNIDTNTLIEESVLEQILKSLALFLNIKNTIQNHKVNIEKNALHDTNQQLLSIDRKCRELNEIVTGIFSDIPFPQNHNIQVKVQDIKLYNSEVKQSFKYLIGESKNNSIKKDIDEDIASVKVLFSPDMTYNSNIQHIYLRIKHSKLADLAKAKRISLPLGINYKKVLNIPEEAIFRVFYNLLQNAIKYSKSGSKILIVVKENDFEVSVDFINDGLCIERSEKYEIFESKKRGVAVRNYIDIVDGKPVKYEEDKQKQENLGIGLYIAKKIVKFWEGSLVLKKTEKIDQAYCKNTFRVSIPKKYIKE